MFAEGTHPFEESSDYLLWDKVQANDIVENLTVLVRDRYSCNQKYKMKFLCLFLIDFFLTKIGIRKENSANSANSAIMWMKIESDFYHCAKLLTVAYEL